MSSFGILATLLLEFVVIVVDELGDEQWRRCWWMGLDLKECSNDYCRNYNLKLRSRPPSCNLLNEREEF